jgi:xanthine dehydrogenase accessory factor
MSIDCFKTLATVLRAEESAVLATVIQGQGSVPREVGAKMVMAGNDRSFLTIGGGAGEAKVVQAAQTVLKTGQKQRVAIDLTGASQRQTEGICGGQMQVWLERWSGKTAIALAEKICTSLEEGKPITLITPYAQNQFPYILPEASLLPHRETAFSEILEPAPLLLIVGAGHVGEQLAKAANFVGFKIAIQDDRPQWANREKYPQARWIFNQNLEISLQSFPLHPQLYAAMVTRGYTYDLEALETLLHRSLPCRYLGMIGSEKRVKTVYQELIKQGIASEQLASLYAPIGLDIEALTPEEIAVSICAELIMVRRGGTGLPLSTPMRKLLSPNPS